MPNKRVWIIAGFLITGAGVTAVAAHGLKHAHDRGDHGRYSDYNNEHDEDALRGGHRGWRHAPMSKEDFDARTRARFARIDANGDGVIDKDEVAKAIEKRMQRHGPRWERRDRRFARRVIRRFDVDKDGKVTKAELEGRVAEMFARLDLNGDDRITDADLPPMLRGRDFLRGANEFGGPRGRRGPRYMRFLRGADANDDGMIALDEAQTAAAKRFARWDYNKDGVVDRLDRQSLHTDFKDYRVKRFLHRFGGTAAGQVTREQFNAFYAERFARLDYDNNGELTRDEMPARGERMGRRWHRHGDDRGWHHRRYEGGGRYLHEENEAGPRRRVPDGTPEADTRREL